MATKENGRVRCQKCSADLPDHARFCHQCGTEQKSLAETSAASGTCADSSSRTVAIPNKLSKRVGWIVAAIVGVVLLLSVFAGRPAANDSVDAINEMVASNVSDLTATATPLPLTKQSNWTYSADTDKVRGTTIYAASIFSTNNIQQSSPYDGETTMAITVRKSASGTDVMLRISSGQMMCPSYEGCSGTVRFDDGAAERIRFNGPTDDSSEVIFVVGARSFITKLKRANKVIVEKTLYQAGAPQFEFDTSGLRWDH